MECLNINFLYSIVSIGIISYLIYIDSFALLITFVVMSHAHYILSYFWTIRYNLKLLFVLFGTALFFLAVFKSPLSTDLIVLITSFAFLFHFWTDEVKMFSNPESKFKSIREAHYFVFLIFIAVLTLLTFLQPKITGIGQYIQVFSSVFIYRFIVVYHAFKWIFHTHQKWRSHSKSEYALYLISIVLVHAIFFILLKNIDPNSTVFLMLFEVRALYTWGLIHIAYTYINRRLKHQAPLAVL